MAIQSYCHNRIKALVVGAGLLKPVEINGVTKYAPWFAFDQNTGKLTHSELCFDESECRY
ncbi:MAG: hypothetical protein AB4041_10910 [Microcystaceae cyanobacterium]